MPPETEKQRRKRVHQQLRAAANEAFLAGLPIQLLLFKKLFDYLDDKLATISCDNTLHLTERFARENQVPFGALEAWLSEHGGYCDCEVIANVEEKFEGLL